VKVKKSLRKEKQKVDGKNAIAQRSKTEIPLFGIPFVTIKKSNSLKVFVCFFPIRCVSNIYEQMHESRTTMSKDDASPTFTETFTNMQESDLPEFNSRWQGKWPSAPPGYGQIILDFCRA
jgi:hypothetical protein